MKSTQRGLARQKSRSIARSNAAAIQKRRSFRSMFGNAGYDGARTDIRELRSWTPALGSPDQDILWDLPALRARARDAERNQPLAAGAIRTKLDNIVGSGLTPSAEIDREALGIDAETAYGIERQMDRIYAVVTSRSGFDAAGKLTFGQLQRLALHTRLTSGDAFVVRRYIPRAGDVVALKLQLLESDRCSNPDNRQNDILLRDGVAVDEVGCATGYWFSNQYPSESALGAGAALTWSFMPARGQTGSPLVLHVAEQIRSGQSRGVPVLAPVLRQLKQIDRAIDSELAAWVISSMFTVFVKTTNEGTERPLSDLEDDAIRDLVASANEMKLGHGAIVGLDENQSIEIANPSRPNPNIDGFLDTLARCIGVALGIPKELLLKTFNSSYSASRAALHEAWRTFETQQDWLVSSLCQPVYEWVIDEAVARGLLNAPGYVEDPFIRAAYLGTTWTGPTITSLDPEKEVRAAERAMRAGLGSRHIYTPQLTGKHWRTVNDQLEKERSARKEAQLDVTDATESLDLSNNDPLSTDDDTAEESHGS